MAGNYTDPQYSNVSSSLSWQLVFGVSQTTDNSFQVMKMSTGTLTAVTLEGTNMAQTIGQAKLLPSYQWFPIPEFSGTLLTGSAAASVGFNLDNLNCKYVRVTVTAGNADTFGLAWHGKSGD